MSEENEKVSLQGRDPAKPFFMAISVGNADGSISNPDHSEGVEAICETQKEAEERMKFVNGEYPDLEGWVYHCIPVARIWRGKTRVTPIKRGKS